MHNKTRLKFITTLLPKSHIQASFGENNGKYPFFTSSKVQNKFLDDYQFDSENIIMGTGGVASIHYYNGKFSVSTDCIVLKIDKSYSTKFIYYFLKSKQKIIDDLGFKGSGLKHLQKDFLFNLNIDLISLNKQNSIVKFLDGEMAKIDNIIDEYKILRELFEEKRISLINKVVTKGLNPNVPMKDSGIEWIGEIPKNAEIISFRRICTLNQGLQFPQNERLWEPHENAMIYITVKYLHSDRSVKEYIPDPTSRVICNKDDVLLARTGATGEVFTNLSGVFHNNFFKINYNNNIDKDFLVYYLKMDSLRRILLLKAGVTTIPDLNHDSFLDTPFILHPLNIQKKIVEYLDEEVFKIDKIILKIQQNIELLEEYKTSLIHHAVTGKVDVRGEKA